MAQDNEELSKEEKIAVKEREEQIKEFELLKKVKLNQSNNLDKNLITLSSGSVGLIVSVLLKNNPENILTLKLSLLCFVITVVCTVISFYFGINAQQNKIDELNCRISQKPVQKNTNWNFLIDKTTQISVICFLVGVVSLLYAYL